MGNLRHDVGKLEHLRAQRLLPREGKKLSSKASSAVRIRLDLLDIVIVAVARRMPHQHQIAVPDDRGQDIVEVMRDAAGKLADDLHFRGLGDLPLELGFLAIVLEQQQHRGVAEAAQAGDGQRDRLRRLSREADRKIGTLALMDVYGRVASTLLELSVYSDGKLMVGEKLSQQDLANMVGASREMVNRILKDLSDRGFISIESKAITIIGSPVSAA